MTGSILPGPAPTEVTAVLLERLVGALRVGGRDPLACTEGEGLEDGLLCRPRGCPAGAAPRRPPPDGPQEQCSVRDTRRQDGRPPPGRARSSAWRAGSREEPPWIRVRLARIASQLPAEGWAGPAPRGRRSVSAGTPSSGSIKGREQVLRVKWGSAAARRAVGRPPRPPGRLLGELVQLHRQSRFVAVRRAVRPRGQDQFARARKASAEARASSDRWVGRTTRTRT